VKSGAVLTADDKVLVTTESALVSIDGVTGRVDWSQDTGLSQADLCHPVVHPVSGDIYVPDLANYRVYCFSSSGTLKWTTTVAGKVSYYLARQRYTDYRPTLTPDGELLFVAFDGIIAINTADGTEVWSAGIHTHLGGAVLDAATGLAYFCLSSTQIACVEPGNWTSYRYRVGECG
jgi:hypothetical protein